MIAALNIFNKKGALCLFFFSAFFFAKGQEILWKGKELQSAKFKTIDGEITIRTSEDTIRASKAIIYQNPQKATLKGNVSLVRTGTLVTSDSAQYFPATKRVFLYGNVVINSPEGVLRSEAFQYDLNSKQLLSLKPVNGQANGIQFTGSNCQIFTQSQNMKLWGNAKWENDTILGNADSIYLDRTQNLLRMSRRAKINFKKKNDEIVGSLIELDLKSSKIVRIEGSKVKRSDVRLGAKRIQQIGDDYLLNDEVEIQSADSTVTTYGTKAFVQKSGMQMTGPTKTRLLDKEKKEVWIYSPKLISKKDSGVDQYQFYKNTNIRGQFDGFGDSLVVVAKEGKKETILYGHSHLQNDSLFVRGDTLELIQIDGGDIIKARRNAFLVMISKPFKVNLIYAAYVEIKRTETASELYAIGSVESFLWNTEKENPGLNRTKSATQRAIIREKKISKVKTSGPTESVFTPQKKVDNAYKDPAVLKLKEIYATDTLQPGSNPIKPFWEYFSPIKKKK